ncbi:MAG: hypothetical protein QOJ60_3122, partial [Actinomycetota bacterium]|nr:hypothetical protein [Actinomycetota bacterium]
MVALLWTLALLDAAVLAYFLIRSLVHGRGPVRWLREHVILIVAVLSFEYMLLPNIVVVLFS